MLKDTLLQHKAERDATSRRSFVPREGLRQAQKALPTPLAKVIVGPRRAGKSVFGHLLLRGSNYAYVNFDDEALHGLRGYDHLISTVHEVYGEPEFLFFDEIQNLPRWELMVNKLLRRGRNVVLTGSNANLLSRELGTALTGRYLALEVLPFSFREFAAARGAALPGQSPPLPEAKGRLLHLLGEYLVLGGYPEVSTTTVEARAYLSTLVDAVLFKDIVRRSRIRSAEQLYQVAIHVFSSFATEMSFTRVKNALSLPSTATVAKYIRLLEEAYLVFTLRRFSFKVREQAKAARKPYLVDTGLAAAKAFQFSRNTGRLMENVVFLELVRRGYQPNRDLFTYRTRAGHEVDFVLRQGQLVTGFLQVCAELGSAGTRLRESRALDEAAAECRSAAPKTIIVWDEERDESPGKLAIVPLWRWLTQA